MLPGGINWDRHASCTSQNPTSERGGEMDSQGKHQRDASVTDQKNRTDDEHILELDKQHLKESERNAGPIPTQGDKGATHKAKKV
jgi:hypothetical protein